MDNTRSIILLVVMFASGTFIGLASVDVPYKEFYFEQTIDHFNVYWKSYGKETFMQRYLVQGEREMWTE